MTWTFPVLLTLVTLASSGYILWFVRGVVKYKWRWVNQASCGTYVGVANTLITSSGIAAALLASLRTDRVPPSMLRRPMTLLVASIVFGVFFILIFARSTETAVSRHTEECLRRKEPNPAREGMLSNAELSAILLFAWAAITAFLWGFLYLGRLVFHIRATGHGLSKRSRAQVSGNVRRCRWANGAAGLRGVPCHRARGIPRLEASAPK
jgi:NADH:ubiquinone oxidoreductase subunit 5 (subunit L)/multisubunit Na+/H+ antiporter MnhA subunit